jgi:hypothetical protein
LFLALTSIAHAEAPLGPNTDAAAGAAENHDPSERPWAKGVSDDARRQALGLFEEGNKLFEGSEYAAALARYREALKVWDHPAIRYNAAVALINLDQPLSANENLELALRYGAAPFNPETHQQALTYQKLLRGQLAQLKVTCAEADAEVTLDGKRLFASPGESTRWLLAGPHELVARKPGFLTETRSLNLLPGKPAVEAISLQESQTPRTKTVRRWEPWKPWAVVGAGAFVALAGVPVILDAKKNIDAFDKEIASCSQGTTDGCTAVPPRAVEARDRSHVESIVAVSLFTVGGLLLAGGAAMLIGNQPRVVPDEPPIKATIVPTLGPGAFGLSLSLAH